MSAKGILTDIEAEACAFIERDPGNRVSREAALCPDVAGVQLFDSPLFGVAAASDPLFAALRDPDAVGPQMLLPGGFLPGAQSVLSYFVPMSERVRASNRGGRPASDEWFHARIEGQEFILRLGEFIVGLLEKAGYDAVCPARHPRMQAFFDDEDPMRSYRSTWSERHVAYACGLGTFSLSKGIITDKGMAGRLGSVVTTAELPITTRPYTGIYDYCIHCGACVERCPAGAISLVQGKDHKLCHGEMIRSREVHEGYLGCGKCQVNVPCEHARP